MDIFSQIIIPIISLTCNAIVAILVAIIGLYNKKAETNIKKAETNIERISDNLPSWEVLYEHDENGKQINGNID